MDEKALLNEIKEALILHDQEEIASVGDDAERLILDDWQNITDDNVIHLKDGFELCLKQVRDSK